MFFLKPSFLNSLWKVNRYLIHKMNQKFDLVIIGAGCVGMAAAYYALKMNRTVCIIEKNTIGDVRKFWSESFIARQNRLQTNEEYLTRFIKASNDQWKKVEQEIGNGTKFVHKQGTLWFGDKHVNTTEGNIKTANETIMQINSRLKEGERKIQSLFIDKVIHESPKYMRAFKPENQSEWDSWSSLYQSQGGSINMKGSYDAFYNYVKSYKDKVAIYDNTLVVKHQSSKTQFKHIFTTSNHKTLQGKSVFICTGIYTPHFLKDVMNFPHLVENNYKNGECNRKYRIEEYVSSYIKIQKGYENYFSHIPSFINFIKQNSQQSTYTTFGFPFHEWDTVKNEFFIKIGTMANKKCDSLEKQMKFLKTTANQFHSVPKDDPRVIAATTYVTKRMNGISSTGAQSKHYPYPMIFYNGRETILDYLQRNDQSIVVQSGGWIVNEYPLMAKTVVEMLFQPKKIKKECQDGTVIGSFLNMTRFPIKSYVHDRINKMNYNYPKNGQFKTVIIGAGCGGLYSAFRLNQVSKDNICIFDMNEHISGGLKSFEIRSTTSPIELEQLKYIPSKHSLLNQMVMQLGVPKVTLPMQTQSIKTTMRRFSMKSNTYKLIDWQRKQEIDPIFTHSLILKGHLLGMTAYQIISFSLYQILTAPENIGILTELFLQKTKDEIAVQRQMARTLKKTIHVEDIYYRNWRNYVFKDNYNPLCYHVNLTLLQWNRLRQVLLFRLPYEVTQKDIYKGQEPVDVTQLYPLYKFGFQNVLETQFGHQIYKFVAEQNGYFSNTSNASYIDQVMTYLLDYGDVCYSTLSGGFDNINYAMVNQLLDEQKGLVAKNGGIYLSHKLVNIQKVNNKYLLTFHCKNENTPVPMEDEFRCQLLSGVKKSKLQNIVHKGLGVPVPLPQKQGFSSIQFMAEKIIFGIPKKSIQALCKEIDLLQQPISTYEELYKTDHRYYENLYHFSRLTEQKGRDCKPLTQEQKQQREKLLKKQKLFFKDPTVNSQLSPTQSKQLIMLSERCFYSMVMPRMQMYMKDRQQKIKRFTEQQPVVPKTLFSLTETTQAVPAFKVIMNFTKNWWDPIERATQASQYVTKCSVQSMNIKEIKSVSVNQLSVRHTLQVSLGQDNLLMCSYNDRISTQYWLTLHKNFEKVWTPKPQTLKQMKLSSTKPIISCPENQNFYPAKEVIVREMLKQLSRIHNTEVKQQWLKQCVYQFLGNDYSGAGYHHFNSGYYVPTIMQCMRKPWKNESIHFVGEVFSNMSGSVEGAFQTSEHLLQKEFGVQPLVKNYYAGY